ncbi:MAG: hypothetical protein CVV29_00320 [Methanobacteriales archaeon HGW-Methanobacteriales-2]|nr:MAG: hypothetical protein CVV29_00320 [Methanobacteriales archaeon HGW-Methanobacteriales-2]
MSKFNFNSQFSKLKEIMDNYSKKIGIDLDYFIKNSFLTILIQISNITLSLILTIFLARFTTKDVFGSYNFIISIISMLTIISMPGFNFTLIKSASRGKDGLYNKIFKLRFFWSLIGVPFLIFVGLYYFYFENQMIGLGLLLASIFFPFFDPPTIWVKLLQGKKRFDLVTKNSIIIIFIRTVTIIIATILGSGNIIPILIAFLIAHSSLNLLYYYKSKNLLINNEIEEKWKKSGYKLTFVELSSYIYNYADKIIVGVILGPVELAIYVIATNIIYQIIGSIDQLLKVIYPKIFEMNSDSIIKSLKRFIFKFTLLIVGFVFLLILILPTLIPLLFSSEYADAILLAQISTLIIPFNILTYLSDPIIVAFNREDVLFKFRLIGICLYLSCYIILIIYLGLVGVVISSIIYYMTLMLLQFFYIFRREKTN